MTITTKMFDNKFENKTAFTGSNGKKLYDLPQSTIYKITANHSNIANISNAQKKPQQCSCASPNSITMIPTASFSLKRGSTDSGNEFFNPRKRNKLVSSRQYFAPKLSNDVNSDMEYYSRSGKNYGQRGNLNISNVCLKQWSSQLSSGGMSSNESGLFTGGNHDNEPSSPDIKHQRKPVLHNSKIRGYRSNISTNIRSDWYYGKIPLRTATHYANSKYLNASVASSLPQPPQHWLHRINGKQRNFKYHESKDERDMAKSVNTFDYYNLKLLLTIEP